MTETALDPWPARIASGASGALADFNAAGVLDAVDVHTARRLLANAAAMDDAAARERVALAVAFAVRALRHGSVCLDLRSVAADTVVEPDHSGGEPIVLLWPDPDEWVASVRDCPLAGDPAVLRLEEDRWLYLDRYWREEIQVHDEVVTRLAGGAEPEPTPDELDRVFPEKGYEEQRAAAAIAVRQPLTVVTGGPGTGKTTTVAALLALLAARAETAGDRPLRMALTAPTGKAAARLQEAVLAEVAGLTDAEDVRRLAGLQAVTMHRLLGGLATSSTRFRHDRDNRLPHDVVVVDETSMVSLTMMARLLEALRPDARVILVGDPDQLASVEAGAVLTDLVEGLGARTDVEIAELRTSHRFGPEIRALGAAVRDGDADAVVALLREGGEHVVFEEVEDPGPVLRHVLLAPTLDVRTAALDGDARRALHLAAGHRLLCAHREGPRGVTHWNHQVERWISEEKGEGLWSTWYAGRPVLVTANDYGLGLYNGDAGVTVVDGDSLRVAIDVPEERPIPLYATGRLGDVETMHALTIHKSQGSQAAEVTVLLPHVESRLLTRQLFYTAVTRARERVRIVGTEAEVRAAIGREADRATGLARRLGDG